MRRKNNSRRQRVSNVSIAKHAAEAEPSAETAPPCVHFVWIDIPKIVALVHPTSQEEAGDQRG